MTMQQEGAPSARILPFPSRLSRMDAFLLTIAVMTPLHDQAVERLRTLCADWPAADIEQLRARLDAEGAEELDDMLRLPVTGLRGERVPGGGFLFKGGPDVA